MVKRRVYSKEFKLEAVELSERSEKTVKEVAIELGIPYQVLCKWRSIFRKEGSDSFPGRGNLKPSEQEVHDLKKKLRETEEEREILKKALAIFSSARSKNTGL